MFDVIVNVGTDQVIENSETPQDLSFINGGAACTLTIKYTADGTTYITKVNGVSVAAWAHYNCGVIGGTTLKVTATAPGRLRGYPVNNT